MANARRNNKNAVKLLGVVRRKRSALMMSTALQATVMLVLSLPANAQPAPNARPTGGSVVAGTAAISQSTNNTQINQSTQRAAINWQSFNVGSQQGVTFNQPSASSVTLNRVTGPDPSQIAGRIDANGQIILVNQSGVNFYKGAQVNAAGVMVSTANVSNQNFMAGKMVFDQPGKPNASVNNDGTITIKEAGLAALVAPQVRNSGTITAKLGHVVLAGAQAATLDLYGDGLLSVDITKQVTQAPTGGTALVTNTGLIAADGGTVQLTARAADGIVQNLVEAGGRIRAATVGDKTGTIALNGVGGSITVEGQLAAPGRAPGSVGGNIEVVSSGNVVVASTARINASGKAGGGNIGIGTTLDRVRGGPSVTPALVAANTTVKSGASIKANTTQNGNGGRVVVLSSISGGTTVMNGSITAQGGPQGGDGGFIETSGHVLAMGNTAFIDAGASAPGGKSGLWLLDPVDINITTGATDGTVTNTGGTFQGSNTDTANINNGDIQTALASTNVIITTACGGGTCNGPLDGTITQAAAANITWTSANSLTLHADNNIILNASITGTSGGLTLSAGNTTATGSITINSPISVNTFAATAGSAGTINLNVADPTVAVTTSGGGQSYNSPVTLAVATDLTDTANGNLSFGKIDGTQNFVVNAGSGVATFNGAIGSVTPLNGLTVKAGAAINADVTTKGGMSFAAGHPISLGAPVTLTDTGPGINLGGQVTGGAHSLTLSVVGGASETLNGVTTSGNLTLGTPGNLTLNTGIYTITGGGNPYVFPNVPTTLNGTLTLGQATTFGGPASLGSDTTIDSSAANGSLLFAKIDGAHALSVSTGSGELVFGDAIGSATPLASMTATSANQIALQMASGAGIKTSGTQTYNGHVLFFNNITLDSSAGNGAITFAGALDENGPQDLVLTSGSGSLTLAGISANNLTLTTTGKVTLNTGSYTFAGGVLPAVTTNGTLGLGQATTFGNITLGSDTTIDSFGRNVTFAKIDGTTAGAQSLTVTGGAGAVTFGGAVGGGKSLSDFSATGATVSLGGAVTATGTLALSTTDSGTALTLPFNLSGSTVALNAAGTISQTGGIITAGTLIGSAAAASLNKANAIANIGSFTASSGTFQLTDGGLPGGGTLTVSGPLIGNDVTLSGAPTLAVSGSIGATTTVSLNAVEIDLANAALVTGPTVKLNAGANGINFTGNATIGQSLGTVDINSAGTVNEATTGLIIAGTLVSTSGISGDARLFGANRIDNLGNIPLGGTIAFGLKDANALTVVGTVGEATGKTSNIYLQSSNAGGITVGATGLLKANSGSGLVSLQTDAFANSGSVAGATVELAPNTSGLAMTLGGAGGLSLLTNSGFTTGNFVFGAVTVPGSAQTTTAGSLKVAGSGFATTGVSTVTLDASGAVSQTAPLTGNSQLFGKAASFTLLDSGNVFSAIGLNATAGNIQVVDSAAVVLVGNTASANIYLAAPSETLNGVITAGGILGLQTDAFSRTSGSLTGTTVELAPLTSGSTESLGSGSGLLLSSAAFITGNLRIGAITVPTSGLKTTAGSIDVGAAFGNASLVLELNSQGGITESGGALTAATLTGTANGFVNLDQANAIATLGSFNPGSNAFTLFDNGLAGNLTVNGPVTGTTITIAAAPTISVAGTINATTEAAVTSGAGGLVVQTGGNIIGPDVVLDAVGGGISLTGTGKIGSAGGTVDLNTSGAKDVTEAAGAVVTAGTLISSSGIGGTLDLSAGSNDIANLGSILTVGAIKVNDSGHSGTLGVVGPLSATDVSLVSGTGALTVTGSIFANFTISLDGTKPTAGIALNNGAILTAPTIDLKGGAIGIAMTGNASVGTGTSLVDLATTGGGVTEAATARLFGTLQSISGVVGNVDLLGTNNAVATLGNFAVTGGSNRFVLNDSVGLTVSGTVSAPGQVYLETSNAAGVAIGAGGNVSAGSLASVQADAFSNAGTITGTIFEWAPNTTGATQTLLSTSGLPSNIRIGAVTLPGSASPTITAGSIVVGGNVGTGATTLELDTSGGISEAGAFAITAAKLTGQAGGSVNLTNANTIASVGGFASSGNFTLNDAGLAGNLTLNGPLSGSTVTVQNAPTITVAGSIAGSAAVVLGSGSGGITFANGANVSSASGVVDLSATGSGVREAAGAVLTAATLQSSGGIVGGLALSLGVNDIANLGSIAVSGGDFLLNDAGRTGTLGVGGPVTVDNVFLVSGAGALVVTGSIGSTGTVFLDGSNLAAGIALNGGAVVTGATIDLTGGVVGIALNGNGSLGKAGAVVDLTTAGGGVTEASTATVTAGILQSSGGVVGALDLSRGSNNIATLGSIAVTGGGFLLGDSGRVGTLGVTGPITADDVFIVSGAGALTVTGSINAPGTVFLDGSNLAAGIALNSGAVVTGSTIGLTGGVVGVALNGNASLGKTGAVVDVTTAGGGFIEASTATITAGTLESTGGIAGGVTLPSATNAIANVGSLAVTGGTFSLTDTGDLNVAGRLTASSITIGDTGTLTVSNSLVATSAVSLTAGNIAIPGLVSDGGSGTTSLVANGGTINETGTLIAGTLSGSAKNGGGLQTASLTGAGPTINQIGTLGSFTASAFTLRDGANLNVAGPLTANSITIGDAGTLTVSNSLVATSAVSLTADNIAITGLVSDGGAGTTSLIANGGTINETGTLIAGTLSGSAGGAASLTGSSFANQIATLGSFSASDFSLRDGINLTVNGPVTASSSVTIVDAGTLQVPGSIAPIGSTSSIAVSLTASNIASLGGLISDGGSGATNLIANAGSINIQGNRLIAGTLSGSATSAATVIGDRIANVSNFTASGLVLADGADLTITGNVSGGPSLDVFGARSLTIAGGATASATALNLQGSSINILGTATDGGAGKTSLVASAGTISETGVLIAGTLSGSATGAANLLGVTATSNQVATLGNFTASGFTLNDGINLAVAGALNGGTSATVLDKGTLTINGSVTGTTIGLTADNISIPGLVSDALAGSVALVATSGSITESGTLIAGTLSGSAAGSASFTGANQIANLGNFSSSGFNLNDGTSLSVNGALAGGPSATIVDNGALAIAPGGTVAAKAISLTGSSLSIAGLATDGGAGSTNLVSTFGSINETGTLIAGTLTGIGFPGPVNLTGATPTTNQIGTLGNFRVAGGGFTLNDGIDLTIAGSVIGGPAATSGVPTLIERQLLASSRVTVQDRGALTIAGTVTAAGINLTGNSITIPGTVTTGGFGTVSLTATKSFISESGILITGTLSGSAATTASLVGGTNQIGSLGNFTAAGLTLIDASDLTISGAVNGGPSATITDAGAVTVASGGTLIANTVSVTTNGDIAIHGLVQDANSVNLVTRNGAISEDGTVIADLLNGSAFGNAIFTGSGQSNKVAQLGSFTSGGTLSLTDGTNLTINGPISAPTIIINAGASGITLANNAVITTGGSPRPTGTVTNFPGDTPATTINGAFLTTSGGFTQQGSSTIQGFNGGPAILRITATGAANIAFNPATGLQGTNTWLILAIDNGNASGQINVKSLDVIRNGAQGSTELTGSVGGLSGSAAAGAAGIQPSPNANFRFNSCPIHSVNCVLLPTQGLPVANPLNDISIGTLFNPDDQDDLLLPIVTDQDY